MSDKKICECIPCKHCIKRLDKKRKICECMPCKHCIKRLDKKINKSLWLGEEE